MERSNRAREKALGRDVISLLIRHDRRFGVMQSQRDQFKFRGKYPDLYIFLDVDVNVINETYWFLNGLVSFFYPNSSLGLFRPLMGNGKILLSIFY